MGSDCIRSTELPHTSRLFSDFLYDFPRVARFYGRAPGEALQAAAAVDFPARRRAALVAALAGQNAGNPALETLAREGTVAVVTGQQAGLFAGPCYTVYKALTAVLLARRLSEAGRPAVPVFWVATEDHDLAEVNHCYVFDAAHAPVGLEIAGDNPERRAVGTIPAGRPPVAALDAALRDFPFGPEAVEMAASAYPPGATFGSGFLSLMKRLLAPFPLLYADPMQPALRRLAAPILSEALAGASGIARRLRERNAELEAAGYHAQVHFEERTSLVFLLEDGRRIALAREGEAYSANGRRFGARELMDRAERLSPNALLRPVVQDYILPTAVYVGGPAEIAYLAQSQAIYRALGRPMPAPVPRRSATILDERSARLMAKYGLKLPAFFEGGDSLRERMARKLVPPGLEEAIGRARAQAARSLDELGAAMAAFDPTLAAALATSRRKVEYQLAKLERKAAREAMRRDERAGRDAAYLEGLVYPGKRLQERFYSILPFVARYGPEVIGRLAEALAPDCPDHRVVTF
jgi:bacillithiol biosynthesis cysteine-adding enzyme BshC